MEFCALEDCASLGEFEFVNKVRRAFGALKSHLLPDHFQSPRVFFEACHCPPTAFVMT